MSGRIFMLLAAFAIAIPAAGTAAPTCAGEAGVCAGTAALRDAARMAQASSSGAPGRPAMRPRAAQMPAATPDPSAPDSAAPLSGRPVRRSTPATASPAAPPAATPAIAGTSQAPAGPSVPSSPAGPVTPLASWSVPVPDGCPAGNVLARGDNRIAGQVRGDAICRLLIPDGTAARVTLVGPGPALPDLRVVLYSRVTTDLVPDQPLPVPPGRQELRVLRAPQVPGRTPLPFDLLIRLD